MNYIQFEGRNRTPKFINYLRNIQVTSNLQENKYCFEIFMQVI